MSPFDFIVIIGALCGLLMVLGGLLLFYKGVLTLQQVSKKGDAVSFEFQRVLKIQSRYPALAFFVFGLAFILLALYYARPSPEPTITLLGSIENVADPQAATIQVSLSLWNQSVNDDGKLQKDVQPNFKQVHLVIDSPGNIPSTVTRDVPTVPDAHGLVAQFAPVTLQKIGGAPPAGEIEALPAGVTLPPASAATGFKAAP